MDNETIADLIDLTVLNTQMISSLRRQVAALITVVTELHPEVAKRYLTAFAEADERGESVHERMIAAARKLAAKKDQIRNTGSSEQTQ